MRALCWNATNDVRVETVPDPKILNPRDAIVRITSTAICGSDLHLYDGYIPTMEKGDILGHEFMGEVVEVGHGVKNLTIGDRVVVPFTIACGHCFFCERQLFSLCDNSNPNAWMAEKAYGYSPAGLFGYSHLFGGYAGGQAEYARVPFADVGPLKVPDGLDDEQVLFLSDIFPTGYMAAENCNIQPGDTVAVWGCGPVGQFAIQSACLLGAERVIAIDRFPERLRLARSGGGPRPSTTSEPDVVRGAPRDDRRPGPRLPASTPSAWRPTATPSAPTYDRAKQAFVGMDHRPAHRRPPGHPGLPQGGDRLDPRRLRRPSSTRCPSAPRFQKGLTLKMGQTHVHRYMQAAPRADRQRGDRPLARHHPPAEARRGGRRLQDVPRQGGPLHQGRLEAGRFRRQAWLHERSQPRARSELRDGRERQGAGFVKVTDREALREVAAPTAAFAMAATAATVVGLALAARAVRRSPPMDFQGKSVLITGGSRGLGLLLARRFATAGARLTIVAREPAELDLARRELTALAGARVLALPADVGNREDMEWAVERAAERFGRLDVVVNNAGIIQVGPLEHMTVEDFENAMAVHFWGPLYTTLAALPHLRQQGGGRIVNIASVGGKIAVPHLVPYSASKFALVGLSNGLQAELAKEGIRVTTVCPGLMPAPARTSTPGSRGTSGRSSPGSPSRTPSPSPRWPASAPPAVSLKPAATASRT